MKHLAYVVVLLGMVAVLGGCSLQSIPLGPMSEGGLDDDGVLAAQGFQDIMEVLGPERDVLVQEALDDWRVQGWQEVLENEFGLQFDRAAAQVFRFRRGSHEGRIVLLPYGERLLTYVQFGDLRDTMLTPYKPGVRFAPVVDGKLRTAILQRLKAHGLPRIEERLGTHIVPGQILLLHEAQEGQALYFVFVNSNRPNKGQGVKAQQVMLTEYEGEGGYACCSYSDSPLESWETTTSTFRFDPGGGGDIPKGSYVPPSLHADLSLNIAVSHTGPYACPTLSNPFRVCITAMPKANAVHSAMTSSTVDILSVRGSLSFQAKSDSCSEMGANRSSIHCTTQLEDSVIIPLGECVEFSAAGSTAASYRDWDWEHNTTVSGSASASGQATSSFGCGD